MAETWSQKIASGVEDLGWDLGVWGPGFWISDFRFGL